MGERIVVITGATGTSGPTVARRFASGGDRLALIARDESSVAEVLASLDGGASRHAAVPADLSTGEGASAAAEEVRRRLGRPSVLLHLVGTYAGGTRLEDADEAEWRRLLDTNLWVPFHVMRAWLPDIRGAAGGRIVTVSTPFAQAPGPNSAGYVASKAAVEALTLSVARELKDTGEGTGATANVVLVRAIGDGKPTETRPEELAATLWWLCSPEAGAVNGQRIGVMGRGL
jgi:NAD(P)-dependent dehydrogenase (short-subunit alcohol dehydrogenase family)